MIDLKNIEKGLEFGRKAEAELTVMKEDKGWQILAEGYRKNLEDLLAEAKKHQPNPDLTRDRLYRLCNKHQWFTSGSVQQYDVLFEMLSEGATTHDLAVMIWICSDTDKWSVESIQKILDEKMWCAVLRGEIHYINDYESVLKFLEEDADLDQDWEMCELSGRIREGA